MKKSHILGLSAAIAGVAVMMPQTASAAISCTATTSNSSPSSCTGGGTDDSFTQEAISFTGSKGVVLDAADSSTSFSACSYHLNGSKSFGMSTDTTVMAIRSSTGATAVSGADACSS